MLFLFLAFAYPAEEVKNTCIIPVKGMIDKGLAGFIKRAIKSAEEKGIKNAIFEIDTFGGRVDAAVEIRDAIIDSKFERKIAFVNKRAISAGALITLSCKDIYMVDGSTIGAAQPITISDSGQPNPVGEKYVSYLRKEFKSTAEKNGHPPKIAEAFVDSDVEIKNVIKKGKLLTLTSKEAEKLGLSKTISSKKDLFEILGITESSVVGYNMNWSEKLVRFLTHPIVSSLLLTLGFMGLLFELKMPGFGVSGTLGVIFLVLFFFGHYLIGLAEWMEILLFIAGLVLLGIEIFLIPGFGITGVSGIVLVFLSIFMSLVEKEKGMPFRMIDYNRAFEVLGTSIVMTVVGVWLIYKFLLKNIEAKSTIIGKMVLQGSLENAKVFEEEKSESLVGKNGVAKTQLRPAGKVEINGEYYNAVTYGDFIEKGEEIIVSEQDGMKLVVEKAKRG